MINTEEVLKTIQGFISEQRINCAEAIYQTDRVAEEALPFIERLCDLVGYYKYPDDEE